MGLLATQVRNEHDVSIVDALKERMNEDAIARLVASQRVDVVGFQAWSNNIHLIKKACIKIKDVRKEAITIVGGIHPTMVAEGTLKFFGECLDYAYNGEGEKGFKMFLDNLASDNISPDSLSKIPGLVWREGSAIKVNENSFIEDLDSIGLPAWDLMPPDSYPRAPHGAFFKNFPVAPIIITRGCPFPCAFCSAPPASGRKIRSRSLESVIEELKLLKYRFGVREFHVEDDNFTLNNKLVGAFCEKLLSLDLAMSWSFPNGIRLDTIDYSLLRLMKRAGCYAINFGVESGSERILKMIKKLTTLEKTRSQLTMAKEVGFDIGGFFIIGFPSETEEEINETIVFACSLPLDRVGVSYFQPFPGTTFFNELVKKGEISEDWADHHSTSLHTLTYVPATLTSERLQHLRQKFLHSFYLQPRVFMNMLKQVRSPSHLYYMTKRAIRWLSV
jgi:radical SAM superfamily enzyme YgiQ (UPF0313 family)